MKHMLLLLLLIPVGWVYGQQNLTGEYKAPVLNGHYSFDYYGDARKIRLWAEAETYAEYDSQGNQLGTGRYLNINNESFLYPETIGQYSLINGDVQFKVIEISGNSATVEFFPEDGQSEHIHLTKL